MSAVQLSRKEKMLVHCAPIREERVDDRALRMALDRARKTEAFAIQQDFDKAATALVQAIPIPQEITDWIPTDTFIAPTRRAWKKYAQNPAFLATGIAVLVIAVVAIFQLVERMNRFPGEATDFFFMKHRLVHYDVPPEFAELKTLGCRVFDDEEGQRVGQVWVVEKKMQFFLFPAERDPKTGKAREFSGWRSIEQERWAGVVKEQNGVCFMAAVHGSAKDLAPYISKPKG